MQVRHTLCLHLLRARPAPPELLFQSPEDFFDLLAVAVMPLEFCRREDGVVRDEVAPPVVDDTDLVADLPQPLKMPPLFSDFSVRPVQTVRGAAHLQMRSHPLVYLRGITLHPPEDSDVIHRQPSLAHHLFEIAVTERNQQTIAGSSTLVR